jgi:hypothetical protein
MPDKPIRYGNLDTILCSLDVRDTPWIDRATLQKYLGVSKRRAQQIMKPLPKEMVGSSYFVRKDFLIAHLRMIAARRRGLLRTPAPKEIRHLH